MPVDPEPNVPHERIRQLSLRLLGIGHLMSAHDPDTPPNADELEGIADLITDCGKKLKQIAERIETESFDHNRSTR
jgi:hypothetical protein